MTADPGPERVPVAIVGAGPVGLALALGLARHGVRSLVLERAATTSSTSKAAGIHVRTREILRRWGVEAAFLDEGTLLDRVTVRRVGDGRRLFEVDLRTLVAEARDPGLLILEQDRTEALLLDAVVASGHAEVRFGAEVTGLAQDHREVRLTVGQAGRDRTVVADHVVGCDGASSTVRRELGLPFEGRTYALRPVLADVELSDRRDALPWPRLHDGAGGLTVGLRLRPGRWRIIRLAHDHGPADDSPSDGEDVTDAEVAAHAARVLGDGPVEVTWASRFRIHRRAAPRFRHGRVLLAGDAAHVHSPVGGQGMNAGIQDAADLAWKLATALDGGDADRLLDAYDVERRAVVVEAVSGTTDVVTRVFLQSPRWVRATAFAVAGLGLRLPGMARLAARRASMLDLDLPSSPLLPADARHAGRRLPDVLLVRPDGREVRLHDLLPVGAAVVEVAASTDTRTEASAPSATAHRCPVLPVRAWLRVGPGALRDPSGQLARLVGPRGGWILVRPDGHVAAVSDDPERTARAAGTAFGVAR
jgi:2-polyprenyl-6-methoxyphenol hydroxylase-like FAD-dependent oxidoreductase